MIVTGSIKHRCTFRRLAVRDGEDEGAAVVPDLRFEDLRFDGMVDPYHGLPISKYEQYNTEPIETLNPEGLGV